jgi:cell division protease FtsH
MSDQGNGNRAPMSTPASRPKESERSTRRPQIVWDRIRVSLFLIVAFLVIVWVRDASNGMTFRETLRDSVGRYWWMIALLGLEIARQFYYFFQEQSERVYRRRTEGSQRWEKRREKVDPFLRFRLGRIVKWAVILWILGSILAPVVENADPSVGQINPIVALARAPALLLSVLPTILQVVLIMFVAVGQFVAIFWFLSRGGIDVIMPDDLETRFTDVKGQDSVLQRVKENIIFLEDPESIEERGGYVPGGVLLWGPPGTGKTLMAQAVAGETGKPFVSVEPSAFINMFIGVGPLKVKSLYRKLRKLATRYGGVIVFFDEADSLGSRGGQVATGIERSTSPFAPVPACNGLAYLSPSAVSAIMADAIPREPATPRKDRIIMGGMGGGGGMGTLQALLSEMSGLTKPRGLMNRVRRWLGMKPKQPPKYRILHIFATNMPDALDSAMRRPGRIDREYKVGYPQQEGRKATYEYYLAKISHELTDEQIDQLATISPYFSGAMIKDIVNEGLVIAIRDGRKVVTYEDVIKAKQLKQHGLPDDHEYIERERHSVAVHEACHAVVANLLRKHAVIDLATIERRGDIGGFVSSIPPEDRFVDWRSEHDADLMTSLASLAGERLFFDGDNSAGVGGDMRSATALAMLMEGYWAMGDSIVSHSVTKANFRPFAQQIESGADRNVWDGEFGRRVETKLQALYEQTWRLLDANRRHVLAVAHALETVKTITGDDVEAILHGTQGPLIDGRPYQDPQFLEELERYHTACVAAHQEHGDVGGIIPVPVPPAPSGALSVAAAPPSGNGDRRAAGATTAPFATDPPRPDTT